MRIETDLDQETSGSGRRRDGEAHHPREMMKITCYFKEVGASISVAALAFPRPCWMRYLARKKALEREA
jgi:hypothetical protein